MSSSQYFCGLCLTYREDISSISNTQTLEMFEKLTTIKIDPQSFSMACTKCNMKLEMAYNIQQEFIRNTTMFTEINIFAPKDEIYEDENEIVSVEPKISDDEYEYEEKFPNRLGNFEEVIMNDHDYHLLDHDIKTEVKDIKPTLKKKKQKDNKGPFLCDFCDKTFPMKTVLTRHIYNHHATKTCPFCNKEIIKGNFIRHRDQHTGPHICEACGLSLKTRKSLRMHKFLLHSSFKGFKCQFCPKSLRSKSHLKMHERKEHLGQATHICDYCGRGFFANEYLTRHVHAIHLKLKNFSCDVCSTAFSTKYALRTHRRQHTNELPYKCELCDRSFIVNVGLKRHLKSAHKIVEDKTVKCEECGKGFASKVALYSHTTKKHI